MFIMNCWQYLLLIFPLIFQPCKGFVDQAADAVDIFGGDYYDYDTPNEEVTTSFNFNNTVYEHEYYTLNSEEHYGNEVSLGRGSIRD